MPNATVNLGKLANTCFVIMPFSSTFESEYNDIIRKAVEEAGLVCVRADELYSKPAVMADIWKSLRAARIIIAELSGKNPNVFYEVGLAHAIGKPVIIITRNQEDVPFDLKALRYLYYDLNNPFWGLNLKEALIEMIKNLLKEKDYGTVLENITLSGKVEFKEIKTAKKPNLTQKTQPPNLTGVWTGEMVLPNALYDLRMELVHKDSELTGTLILCFEGEKPGQIVVVQEELRGSTEFNTASIYGVSFTYLRQATNEEYSLDTFFGKISNHGNKISGKCTDAQQVSGTFSLIREQK